MVDFYFDKSFFCTPFYLYCKSDGTTKKLYKKPTTGICVGEEESILIAKLYGFGIPRFPPIKYRRFFSKKTEDFSSVPWNLVLPKHAYKSQVRSVISAMKEMFENLDLSYYNKYYKNQNQIFEDLKPAKIDVKNLVRILSSHEDKQGHLRSFLTDNGFAQVPVYTRTNTRTGRLSVKKGPMILNVKKSYRDIIISRFNGGSIYQLDYSSLEPRILLTLNDDSEDETPEDVYQSVIDKLDLSGVPREAIKEAVLSRIFGAADHTILNQLKNIVDYPEDILTLVDEYFGIDKLKEKLVSEFSINTGSHIENNYGRHILCEDTPLYVLLNYYIQSTGVDVCLFGFNQVNDKIKEAGIQDKILPLFILHDALFVDVHPDYEYLIPKLCKVGSMDIPKFENTNFYLKAEKLV